MNGTKRAGLMIYELPITMLLIGIFLSAGVPGMRPFFQKSRMTGTADDLKSGF